MADDSTRPTLDLTNCDREPIHIPGAILPHGAMLVVDPETLRIEQVAGDLMGLLGRGAADLQQASLADLLTTRQVARLRALLDTSPLERPRHQLDPAFRVLPDRPIDASVHIRDGSLVIEVEEADPTDPHAVDPLSCVQEMFDGLAGAPDLESYCGLAAVRVRDVTGYDRVMVYRFLEDDSGWVFAEAKRDDLSPFLDLHYPASDIPKQARALYLTSRLRLIAEVNYTPSPLTPTLHPRTGRPLDMTYATLRDVSSIHREYLRNMGVDASMSISIVSEGKLWGLIACHHYTPRRLPRHLRAVCELFGSMFSLQLEARLRAEQLAARLEKRKQLNEIMQTLAGEEDYAIGLGKQAEKLLGCVAADGLSLRLGQSGGGLAIRINDGISTVGNTPSGEQISALTDWLTGHMTNFEGVFATDRLGEVWPPAQAFADVGSGLLAVSVSREPRDFILWFRQEAVRTVTWGGDPRKPIEIGPNGDRLTPRKSFEAWRETVRGRSAPWSNRETDAAFDLRVLLLEVVLRRIDAVARERLRASKQEQLLMAELDHRVKNTLASIQSLVSHTGRSASSLAEFVAGLERRIGSMARAHSLLTQSRWEGASISSLIHEELDAFQRNTGEISIAGANIILAPKAALSLSLALHELATNAAKYGALSVPSGRVAVSWTIDHSGSLDLTWREADGPLVAPPKRRGFGSTLIERALALETGGKARLSFAPTGVVCAIALPPEAVQKVQSALPAGDAATKVYANPAEILLSDQPRRRILVVEDSALILMEIEDILADLRWEVVGPASRLSEALRLARDEDFDAAVLDVNLDGEMSWEVASILKERGIPFLFSTGYDGATVLPTKFAGERIVNKPFKAIDLVKGLSAILGAGKSTDPLSETVGPLR